MVFIILDQFKLWIPSVYLMSHELPSTTRHVTQVELTKTFQAPAFGHSELGSVVVNPGVTIFFLLCFWPTNCKLQSFELKPYQQGLLYTSSLGNIRHFRNEKRIGPNTYADAILNCTLLKFMVFVNVVKFYVRWKTVWNTAILRLTLPNTFKMASATPVTIPETYT